MDKSDNKIRYNICRPFRKIVMKMITRTNSRAMSTMGSVKVRKSTHKSIRDFSRIPGGWLFGSVNNKFRSHSRGAEGAEINILCRMFFT